MTVTLIDPTFSPLGIDGRRAERLSTLDGAVLGLVNNGKTHGREILERVAQQISAKYKIEDIILVTKPDSSFPAGPEDIEMLASGATAIIAAIGD